MGKTERWPGFPERLREALRAAGYWKHDRPDIMRFGLEHGLHVSYLYKYIGGDAVPDRERLVQLGTALHVRPSWLLFGEEAVTKPPSPSPARGGVGRQMVPAAGRPRGHGKKPPKERISAQGDQALCQPRGRTGARHLLSPLPAAAHGIRRRAA